MLLFAFISVLMSIPSSQNFLLPSSMASLAVTLGIAVLGIVLLVAGYFVFGYACCVLSRFFYSVITRDEPYSARECWQFVRQRGWSIFWLLAMSLVLIILFGLLDAVLLFFSMTLSLAVGVLGPIQTIAQQPANMIVAIFAFLLWGFIVMGVMIMAASVQILLAFLMVAVSTSDGQTPWQSARYSVRLFSANMGKAISFSMALFVFSLILSIALYIPVSTWIWFEQNRLGLQQQYALAFHIQVVASLWSSVINLVLTPYYISAITLFWYDCQTRKEALDLKLWFNNIVARRGRIPPRHDDNRWRVAG